jgi:oxalate decarboxylase
MQPLSRRNVLTAAAAGTVVTASIAANAQTFGNPDLPPQGASTRWTIRRV